MAASEYVECTINDAILKIMRRRRYAGRAIAVSGDSKARVAPPADPRAPVLAPAPSEAAVAAAGMQAPGMSGAGQAQDRDKARETGGLEDESSEDDVGEEDEGAAPGPKPARRRSKAKKTRRHR
jgi:hypothetical protein